MFCSPVPEVQTDTPCFFGPMFVNKFPRQILLTSLFSLQHFLLYGQDSYNQMQLYNVFDPNKGVMNNYISLTPI